MHDHATLPFPIFHETMDYPMRGFKEVEDLERLANVPRLVKSCSVRCADRPYVVRNTLISRTFRQGPHSGPYKSGVQPPLWAHELIVLRARHFGGSTVDDHSMSK